ncbi:MAG TPA: AAA family ATPase [Acidimicrobiales bacterium]|nr:AAA family ATPase [Acidimicrobiales bacterium]
MSIPRLADDVRLLGRYPGSGFREPRYLIERRDQRMLQVSRLLFIVAANLDGRHSPEEVADRVSTQYRRRLTTEGLQFLVEAKLRPLGLLEDEDTPGQPAPTADTSARATQPPSQPPPSRLLGLRLRLVLLPERFVHVVSALLVGLFLPAVVVAALVSLVAVDVWLLRTASVSDSMAWALTHPVTILVVLAIVAASVVFHEFGHAAACRYGGGRPGRIGMGLYLVYPALYTDVTDAQRLGRAARVRTDLGGVYFNGLAILGVAAGYAITGYEPLVLAIVLIHIEILQQLIPIVRLDGYYILTDLVGVPDLFDRVGPVLTSMFPGKRADRRVTELRPGARAAITLWVLLVVPLLLAVTGYIVVRAPEFLRDVWESEQLQVQTLKAAWEAGDAAVVAIALLSMALLALPVLGLTLLAVDFARRVPRLVARAVRAVRRRRRAIPPAAGAATRPVPQEAPMDTKEGRDSAAPVPASTPGPAGESAPASANGNGRGPRATRVNGTKARASMTNLTAADFTEQTMLRRRGRRPTRGWQRAVFVATRGTLNPGPGRAERRELDLLKRLRTPIAGSRRIVVLSRKGGAGKTTTAVMLGHTFASQRGDRVVALDGNPDAGSLAYRIQRQSFETVTSLLAQQEALDRYADMRTYTSQASDTRLEVVASDDDPRISQALGERDYRRAIDILDRHYNLIIIDTGTGILDGAIQGVLGEADQIVVVMPPALDGGRVAAMTLDWLEEHNYGELVRGAVAVINGVRGNGPVEMDRMEAHFSARCAGVVRIPWDAELAAGGQTGFAELRHPTRVAFLDLAAMIAEGFQSRSPRRRSNP